MHRSYGLSFLVLFREQLRFLVVFRDNVEVLFVLVLYFVLMFCFRLCVLVMSGERLEIDTKINNVSFQIFK